VKGFPTNLFTSYSGSRPNVQSFVYFLVAQHLHI